jgi:hypothetical protein
MDKRYQVFVSSTYQDLQEERQEVMHALLELDCIPAGMELFPAANESQWSLIKRVIEDCDYYIVILAGRYGSCAPDGLSYTEMEYQYAAKIGKPIIGFLHKEPGKIQADKCESDKEGKDRLAAFRVLVEQKLCKYWSSPAELGSVVSRSLIRLIRTTPAIGWVRADELPDGNAALELLKLRQRVEDLEKELARARTTAPKGSEGLAQGDELHRLSYKFGWSALALRDVGLFIPDKKVSATFQATWNQIFAVVAPLMITEACEGTLKMALDDFVADTNTESLRKHQDYGHGRLGDFSLDNNDFQTVKVQMLALGLIAKSERSRSLKDIDTYWTLTPYGEETMMRLRAIRATPVRKQEPEGARNKRNGASGQP